MQQYRKYYLKPNGWKQYVVIVDPKGFNCGATQTVEQAKAHIDRLYQAQHYSVRAHA